MALVLLISIVKPNFGICKIITAVIPTIHDTFEALLRFEMSPLHVQITCNPLGDFTWDTLRLFIPVSSCLINII